MGSCYSMGTEFQNFSDKIKSSGGWLQNNVSMLNATNYIVKNS
jgi:hypothetical protein